MLRSNLSLDDTIFALTTGALPTAVAVVKMSGPQAFTVAEKIFTPKNAKLTKSRDVWVGDLHSVSGKKIDDIVAISFVGPNSHSGEDTVEFHCHGSIAVVRALETELLSLSVRPAERGEFSYRSLLNGKQSASEIENLADIFKAVHLVDLDAIHSRKDRGLEEKINELRARLIKLQAVLDTAVDFSEEYSSVSSLAAEETDILIRECSEVTQRYSRFKRGNALPKVVLVGKPNAGKSSLFNAMLGRYRAIVSEEAGTTRDVIEEQIEVSGVPWMVADTAGIRSTESSIEQKGIELGSAYLSSASAWILVIDGTQPMATNEEDLLKNYAHIPHLIFWNKKDLSHWNKPVTSSAYNIVEGSVFSTQDMERFWYQLERLLENFRIAHSGPTPTAVQAGRLETVAETLKHLRSQVDMTHPPEILAETNRKIMDQLQNVVGKVEVDEVLGRIFSDFCIGK